MKYIYILTFSLVIFLVVGKTSNIEAQSCSGTVTCCNTWATQNTPAGCSTSCPPLSTTCVKCTGSSSFCSSTGSVQSCGWKAGINGQSCAVDFTCDFGSTGSCQGVAAPQPTRLPTIAAPPTSTTRPGFPSSTPAPTSAPQTSCSVGSCTPGNACPGTGNPAGSCSGGICCVAGNQCDGQRDIVGVTAAIVGIDPANPNNTLYTISWTTVGSNPYNHEIDVLISPGGKTIQFNKGIPASARSATISLPTGVYQIEVTGRDNCDRADLLVGRVIITVPPPLSCVAQFGPIQPPNPLIRNGTAVPFNVQVFPTGTPNTVSASVQANPINTGLTISPSAATSLTVSYPTVFTFTQQAAFASPDSAFLTATGTVTNALGTVVSCNTTGTISQTVRNPNTTFFLAGGGGDVIAAGSGIAGELRSNLANPVPVTAGGTYFAHNPKPGINDLVNLGLAFSGALTPPLNPNNINAPGWYVGTGSGGYTGLVAKRENTYLGIRDRIQAQLTLDMLTAQNMTEVSQKAGFPCGPDTCVAGVHIIKYTGPTITSNTATAYKDPVVVNRSVLLFADNGNVITIQSPILVAPGVFFGLFTQGSLTIAHEVGEVNGNTDVTAPGYLPQLSGIYFAGGDINFGSGAGVFGCTPVPTPLPPANYNPAVPQCARQIRINGSLIAMGKINFNRKHLGDKPAEYVQFVPDYAYQLYLIGTRQKKYQELLAP